MSHIRVQLFGGPEVRRSGESVALSPYQGCLLTLVAAHGPRGLPRTRIIRTLWGDPDSPRARHRLRQLLHELRQRTSPELLGSDEADPVALVDADCDLEAWHGLVEGGELVEAARMLARGFATRIERSPSRSFTDWLDGRRQALRSHLDERVARDWDTALRASEWHDARRAAEALYVLDPSDEERLRCVLRSRAMTGDVQAARAAAAAHRERCGDEGRGLEPETLELLSRVRELAEEQAALAMLGSDRMAIPLVGRREILAELEARLDRIARGTVELALLTGEGGIGKTRILEEVGRRARLKGIRVLGARPVEVERRLPLSALAEALGVDEVREHVVALDEPWRTLVAAFLPTHEGVPTLDELPPIQESALSRRLQDAFAILLRSLAEERPTVLLMDDLQWVDDTTLAVLRSLKRRWDSCPLGIVGAARPPVGPGRRWPSAYLNDLKVLATVRVELPGLSDEEAQTLVRSASDRELAEAEVDGLAALGGNNPFFLIELARDHMAGRLLVDRAPTEPLPLPISLQELFDQRFQGLGEGARELAEVLAARARPTPVARVARIAGLPLAETVQPLNELVGEGLLRTEEGSLAFAHELFRSAFYHRVGPAAQALRHLQIARELADDPDPPHGELAVHFSKAGERRRAARHGRIAAEQALASGAIAEGSHFLQIVADNETGEEARAEALAELANVLHASHNAERAIPILASAADKLRVIGRRSAALRLDIQRLESAVLQGRLEVGEGLEQIRALRAKAREEEDPVAVAMTLEVDVRLLYHDGRMGEVTNTLQSIQLAAESADLEARCISHRSLGMSVLFGDPDEAFRSAQAAVRLARENEFQDQLALAELRLMVVRTTLGRSLSNEGRALHRTALDRLDGSSHLGVRYCLHNAMGVAALEAGELDMADALFRQSAELFPKMGSTWIRSYYYSNAGTLALSRGEPHKALSLFTEGERIVGERELGALGPSLNAGIGLCHLRMGNLAEARRRAEVVESEFPFGSFNPDLYLSFQSEYLRRRGDWRSGLDLIERASRTLWPRLPVAWLQCQILLLENARAAGVLDDHGDAAWRALNLAHELGMPAHVERLEQLTVTLGR